MDNDSKPASASRVATVGMFDGVHRGHLCLIERVKAEAERRGMTSLVVTMDRHPREVLTGDPPVLLTTRDERLRLLAATGVGGVEVLSFDRTLASLTARDFMSEVLRRRFGVGVLVMGYDHHFGHDGRDASHDDYVRWGREVGIEVVLASELEGDLHVSSSAVRKALCEGDVTLAATMLARRYALEGVVGHGKQVGRELGFPTANITPLGGLLVPADGVYATRVAVNGGHPLAAMTHIGLRPTIDGDPARTIETHILDFEGDLYGQTLRIEFVSRLRSTMHFDSREQLQRQLQADADAVRGRETDELYMRRCLQLARCGGWHAAPNPMVGAVVVCDGRIIGEGYHRACGGPHAEVNAIASVREPELLSRSTIYVSLEPCAHWGKTPPCADLIIEKGIPRVVVGCRDPFAKVDGLGIRKLREAGREVVLGVLEDECRWLNRRFFTFHELHRPYVVLKWAQSADGFIAASGGRPVRFSDALTTQECHHRRVENEAIMVGARTVRTDQPSLTARLWPGRQPRRTVVAGCSPQDCLRQLFEDGVQSVLVEGGACVHQQLIDAGLADEIWVETSDTILGEGVRAAQINGLIKR